MRCSPLRTVLAGLAGGVALNLAMLLTFRLIGFGILHAFVYRWLAPAWPHGIMERTWRLAALVFGLSFLFWEFFTPFNQFGEPFPLIGLELAFWAAIALAESFVIAAICEGRPEAAAGG